MPPNGQHPIYQHSTIPKGPNLFESLNKAGSFLVVVCGLLASLGSVFWLVADRPTKTEMRQLLDDRDRYWRIEIDGLKERQINAIQELHRLQEEVRQYARDRTSDRPG